MYLIIACFYRPNAMCLSQMVPHIMGVLPNFGAKLTLPSLIGD